jgi:hypothetical protein
MSSNWGQQTDAVVDIITTNHALAENLARTATDALEQIAESSSGYQLLDINIDVAPSVSSTATVPSVTPADDHSAWVSDAIAALPDPPTVPSVSVTIPEFTATAPTALTGSVGSPGSPTTDEFPTISALGTVPAIAASVPTIDLAVLSAPFSYTEPTFTGKISSTLQSAITGVLGGTGILPQSYWDALVLKAVGDLADERDGLLRDARNSGAAAWFDMPTEAVLAASQRINDSYSKATLKARLETQLAQQLAAREDFLKAMEQGIAFEGLWISYSDHVAERALGSAQHAVNLAVAVHNANASRFNLLLEGARTDLSIDQADVARSLSMHKEQLEESAQRLDQIKTQLAKYQAEWEEKTRAFSADSERGSHAATIFGKQVDYWTAQIDAEIKTKGFPLQKAEIEARIYQTVNGAIGELSRAIAALSEAHNGGQKLLIDRAAVDVDREAKANQATVSAANVAEASQEATVRYRLAQQQWLEGQASEDRRHVAQLTQGLAGALYSASDVSLGAATHMSQSIGYSASMNSEKVWSAGFTND